MRTFHRILAIITVVVMLYLGVTGTLIQAIDLYTLHTDKPQADPVMLSINEGRWGNGELAAITIDDLGAPALPQDFNYDQAFQTTLQAMHAQAPDAAPNYVEVRMKEGAPVGQVRLDKDVKAFDAQTGAAVEALVGTTSRTANLPRTLRQKTKELHRYWGIQWESVWGRRDLPGVFVELVSGILLLTLIVTGLVMYFQLLKARQKMNKSQLFWVAGGWWRSLHRSISMVAAVLLVCVAFSGTWLGFESVFSAFNRGRGGPQAPVTLSDADALQMAGATLASFRALEPETPIKALRVRMFGTMKQGVVIAGGEDTRQVLINTANGKVASLTEPEYPKVNFPFGVQTHEDFKHFHSGDLFGLPARWLSLLTGLALIYLSISGIVMYFDLWSKRKKLGRKGFLWMK